MADSRRFEPIADLARNSEREAAKALGQALQQLEAHQAQLQQLIDYQAEYRRRLSDSASQGMNAQALNEYREFVAKLAQAIDRQERVVEQLRRELEDSKRYWFAKRGHSKALDMVLERYIKSERRALEKKEQRDHDDRNNRVKHD
ncbi:hypothetical protein Tel_05665 [Candidatus Tenderia electrophaga]|jgi:flagellar FliJ protein|uniref:Flagellar FliJ protein n=1 Tax=Candidatus Tenderia electrophaga TaxID=1748243 RepID=A0A0S2TBY3_9GAMM|nr:hypothetical protein Tel_05665 [Candidatus Tenderia electrophaga]